jgi:hypothetical protein
MHQFSYSMCCTITISMIISNSCLIAATAHSLYGCACVQLVGDVHQPLPGLLGLPIRRQQHTITAEPQTCGTPEECMQMHISVVQMSSACDWKLLLLYVCLQRVHDQAVGNNSSCEQAQGQTVQHRQV